MLVGTESPPVPERNCTRIGERTIQNELPAYISTKAYSLGEIRNENE